MCTHTGTPHQESRHFARIYLLWHPISLAAGESNVSIKWWILEVPEVKSCWKDHCLHSLYGFWCSCWENTLVRSLPAHVTAHTGTSVWCLIDEDIYAAHLPAAINCVLNRCIRSDLTFWMFWWEQVKTMRVLQYFPVVEDPNVRRGLFDVSHIFLTLSTHLEFMLCEWNKTALTSLQNEYALWWCVVWFIPTRWEWDSANYWMLDFTRCLVSWWTQFVNHYMAGHWFSCLHFASLTHASWCIELGDCCKVRSS